MTNRELENWLYNNMPKEKHCQCKGGIIPKYGKEEYARLRLSALCHGLKFPVREPELKCPHAPKYTEGERFQQLLEKCAEKCRKDGQTLSIRRNCNCWDVFSRDHYDRHSEQSETLPLTISRFAFVLFGGDTKKS